MGKVCPDFMCHSNICSVITYRMYNHSSLLHEFSWHHSLPQSSAARESWGNACSKLVLRLREQMNGAVPSSESLMCACTHVLLARPGHSRADSLEHCPMCCDCHELRLHPSTCGHLAMSSSQEQPKRRSTSPCKFNLRMAAPPSA